MEDEKYYLIEVCPPVAAGEGTFAVSEIVKIKRGDKTEVFHINIKSPQTVEIEGYPRFIIEEKEYIEEIIRENELEKWAIEYDWVEIKATGVAEWYKSNNVNLERYK